MKYLEFSVKIYELVKRIPKGQVTTYGQIADQLGISPRMVGYALHRNPDPNTIPCHRVVFSDGRLSHNFAFGGYREQKRKLLSESVRFDKDKVIF